MVKLHGFLPLAVTAYFMIRRGKALWPSGISIISACHLSFFAFMMGSGVFGHEARVGVFLPTALRMLCHMPFPFSLTHVAPVHTLSVVLLVWNLGLGFISPRRCYLKNRNAVRLPQQFIPFWPQHSFPPSCSLCSSSPSARRGWEGSSSQTRSSKALNYCHLGAGWQACLWGLPFHAAWEAVLSPALSFVSLFLHLPYIPADY